MVKRSYMVNGITPRLANQWNRDIREDFKLSTDKESGRIIGTIKLSRLEAMVMRFQIINYNLTHSHKLSLTKCKGKHF